MKRFLGFIKKEFYHIFRDKRSMFILFGMPIAQIMLFGFAITNEINNVNIAILDKSKDSETQKIINKISASQYFHIEQTINSESQIQSIFEKGKVKAVIIFENNFSKNLQTAKQGKVQIITDATDPNIANTITNYTNAILLNYIQEVNKTNIPTYSIDTQTQLYYNPELKGVFTFVPGVMTVILMLVSAMMTSISITREKELGTMEVLLVSPLNPLQVILGKVFPYVFLSIINATVIVILGVFVFGMPIQGSLFLLAAESILFIITALSLGILISNIAQTQQTAMMMSLMGLMLPVIILSGFIFPISSMPLPLQIISNIIPAKWFIIIIKAIMLKGATIDIIWKETLILIGMTLFFILLSIKKYKIRLE
ncbi:ABC-2 type transport system permease protein [Flavobacterium glycines]|uniref:Transport permease protein n=1 Tax=Flavobacterium glycines TaxID=551990 RepID=A0A1B9DYG0_9FLAO|nr:ABC transporter permease [Flavobacterium glycines]OCB74724.1 multidrug ABC transporter permease [Flavobacterium glycines]GEL09295.1 transport permease protein [Flavobacterium glycines]SDJ12037.1 ABC-2 type transport system permease protein [Flavobacterium glycines]